MSAPDGQDPGPVPDVTERPANTPAEGSLRKANLTPCKAIASGVGWDLRRNPDGIGAHTRGGLENGG
jgi:hypothetical protein